MEVRFNWVLQRHVLLPHWSYVGCLHISHVECSKWLCRDVLIKCLKPDADREEVVHLDFPAHGGRNTKVRILWQSSHRVQAMFNGALSKENGANDVKAKTSPVALMKDEGD